MGLLAAGGVFEVKLDHIRLVWVVLGVFHIICNDMLFNCGNERSELYKPGLYAIS